MAMTRRPYESFLLQHVSAISTVESSLRSLTWFLPGRFKDAELASEALSASLNVLSLYHDALVAKVVLSDPKYRPLIPPSLHTRYTRAWSDKTTVYRWVARSLELLRFSELVLEMLLQRKVSRRNKWRAIVLLELIKFILRFMLLRRTRRPLVTPPIPERDIDPATIESISPPPQEDEPSRDEPLQTPHHLQNNVVPLPPHPLLAPRLQTLNGGPDTSVEDFLLSKALTTSSVKPSLSLVRQLASPQDWVSEVLYISRPLVFATMLASDRRSNRPLVVAFSLEILSRLLRRRASPSATLERSEYAHRDRDLLWYLLRGAVWTDFTRPRVENIADKIGRVPVLGLFGALVKDWIPLIDEYYYYTAP